MGLTLSFSCTTLTLLRFVAGFAVVFAVGSGGGGTPGSMSAGVSVASTMEDSSPGRSGELS